MTKTMRARYTLEFKKEAVRLVEGGQSIAAAARTLGLVEQTELAPCMTGHGPSLIFEDRSRTVSTNSNTDTVEVIMRDQRRRRWSLAEKSALVKRTYEPGMSVSLVARPGRRCGQPAVPVAQARTPGCVDGRVRRRICGAGL